MRPRRHERRRFRAVLDRFEREGCNLLVVGEVDPSVRRAAARRLFGDPDADRDRVLVAPADDNPDAWLPGTGDVVPFDADVRGAPAPAAVPVGEVPDRISVTTDAPGQFRLGVTPTEPLLNTPVLSTLREIVDRANGLGHFHLSAPVDAVRTRPLSNPFDAVIEIQQGSRGARERWHVDDENLTTGWVVLEIPDGSSGTGRCARE